MSALFCVVTRVNRPVIVLLMFELSKSCADSVSDDCFSNNLTFLLKDTRPTQAEIFHIFDNVTFEMKLYYIK